MQTKAKQPEQPSCHLELVARDGRVVRVLVIDAEASGDLLPEPTSEPRLRAAAHEPRLSKTLRSLAEWTARPMPGFGRRTA